MRFYTNQIVIKLPPFKILPYVRKLFNCACYFSSFSADDDQQVNNTLLDGPMDSGYKIQCSSIINSQYVLYVEFTWIHHTREYIHKSSSSKVQNLSLRHEIIIITFIDRASIAMKSIAMKRIKIATRKTKRKTRRNLLTDMKSRVAQTVVPIYGRRGCRR